MVSALPSFLNQTNRARSIDTATRDPLLGINDKNDAIVGMELSHELTHTMQQHGQHSHQSSAGGLSDLNGQIPNGQIPNGQIMIAAINTEVLTNERFYLEAPPSSQQATQAGISSRSTVLPTDRMISYEFGGYNLGDAGNIALTANGNGLF